MGHVDRKQRLNGNYDLMGIMKRLATAPISWGVCEVPGWGIQLPVDRVLSEMSQLGFRATELGSDGYLPLDPSELRSVLATYNLDLLAAFVPLVIHDRSQAQRCLQETEQMAERLRASGAKYFNTAPVTSFDWAPRTPLSDDEWVQAIAMLAQIDEILTGYDLVQVLHPHVGTIVETRDEVKRLVDSSTVRFVLDTAHLAVGGYDPVEFAKDAGDRVGLVHIKDADMTIAQQLNRGDITLMEAVQNGIFPPVGRGDLDIAGVISYLEGSGYDGWYVLEQDIAITGPEPEPGSGPIQDVQLSVQFLQELESSFGVKPIKGERQMKKMRWLALLLALVMVAASCSDDGDSTATTDGDTGTTAGGGDDGSTTTADVDLTQGGDLTFHMITHSDDGPFWSVVKRGAEAAAADVGVTLVWLPGNNDPGKMVTDIATAVSEGSDGIAASLPSPDQLIGPLQGAVNGGIPVITLNSGSNDYKTIGALTHVGQTEFIAGQGAGERFNAAGVSHVLCGRQEQSNVGLTERCDGLKDTFSGTVTDQFVGLDADQTTQINGIKALLEADDSIDGFLGVGPVIAMSGLSASNDLGRGLVIGGFDITPDIIDAIDAGDVAFTIDQQQYLQGYLPVILLYLNVTNQNTAGGGLPILTGPGFVTPDNAAAVKALVAAGTR